MLIAYLPKEKMVMEADLTANRSLYNHVQRLGLDVATIVPIHGNPIPWSEFVKLVRPK